LDVLAGRARVVARRKQVDVDGPLRALRAGAFFTRKVNDRRHVPLMIDHGLLLILGSPLLKHDRTRQDIYATEKTQADGVNPLTNSGAVNPIFNKTSLPSLDALRPACVP
jgi:hypothetical protein